MSPTALSLVSSPLPLPPSLRACYGRGMTDPWRDAAAGATGITQLFAGMRGELTRFMLARRCDPDVVEDLLQDLYIKLATIRTGPVSNPRAYLYQSANNMLHDYRRGRKRQEDRDDGWARNRFGHDLMSDPDPSPERAAIDRDELHRVERALAAIPARTAEILRLYRVEGQSQKEIARALGITLSAVEKHLQRAYRAVMRLKSELSEEAGIGTMGAADVTTS